MRRARTTLFAAAAAAVVAAAPAASAQTIPFLSVPVGATAVGAWSYGGPRTCAMGAEPWSVVNVAEGWPLVEVACLNRVDMWAYRATDGEYYLTATSDLQYAGVTLGLGALFFEWWGRWQSVAWPVDYRLTWNAGDDGAWVLDQVGKPQQFSTYFEYPIQLQYPGLPPLDDWSSAQFNDVWMQPVAIRAVPEPATIALVATGVLLVGVATRHRRRGRAAGRA